MKKISNESIAEVYAFSIADEECGRNNEGSDEWNSTYQKAYNEKLNELRPKQSLEEAAFECYEKRLFRRRISTDTFKKHIKEAFKSGVKWAKNNNY